MNLKKNIIMKDQELYFRYDTLYITGDRYEFKKVKKRPLGIKLRKSNCLFYKHLIFMYFCPIINF